MLLVRLRSKASKYILLTGFVTIMVMVYHFTQKERESADKAEIYISAVQRAALKTRLSRLWDEYINIQDKLHQQIKQQPDVPKQQFQLNYLKDSSNQIHKEIDFLQQNLHQFDQMQQGRLQDMWTSSTDFTKRKQRVEYVCSKKKVPGNVSHVLANKFGVIYCIVPKAGCTFWKRIFTAGKVNVTSINEISRETVHLPSNEGEPYTTKHDTLEFPTRLIVTRDPFSRLLSSYLDKIYLPDFWRSETSVWIKNRDNNSFSSPNTDFLRGHFNKMDALFKGNLTASNLPTSNEKTCGKYMTFSEFVDDGFHRAEPHWMPIHQICNPCVFKVTHVSLMDTFSEDARLVLSKMRFENFLNDLDENTQADEEISTISTYNFEHFFRNSSEAFYKPCLTQKEIAYRLWHNFRWRGYIDPEVEYKIPEFHDKKRVEEDFMTQVWAARKSGLRNPKAMKNMKKEFKQAAFATIPKSMFHKLIQKYEIDFELFGYTDVRDELFSTLNNS